MEIPARQENSAGDFSSVGNSGSKSQLNKIGRKLIRKSQLSGGLESTFQLSRIGHFSAMNSYMGMLAEWDMQVGNLSSIGKFQLGKKIR